MFPVWSRKAFESLLHHPDPKFNGQVMLPSIPDWVFLISMMIQTWSLVITPKSIGRDDRLYSSPNPDQDHCGGDDEGFFQWQSTSSPKPSSPSFLETLNWEAPLLKGSCRLVNGWIVGARRGHRKELFDRCLIEKQIICHLFGWKSTVLSSAIVSVF